MILTSKSQFKAVSLRNEAGPGFVLTLTDERSREPQTPPPEPLPDEPSDPDPDDEEPA